MAKFDVVWTLLTFRMILESREIRWLLSSIAVCAAVHKIPAHILYFGGSYIYFFYNEQLSPVLLAEHPGN